MVNFIRTYIMLFKKLIQFRNDILCKRKCICNRQKCHKDKYVIYSKKTPYVIPATLIQCNSYSAVNLIQHVLIFSIPSVHGQCFNNSKFIYIQTNYLSWSNRNLTHFILYTINKPLDLCDEISSIHTPDDGKEIMPKHVM
jgi:hypothetical protein